LMLMPASNDVRFQVGVKVTGYTAEDFLLTFDFSGDPGDVEVWCNHDLSGLDGQQLENLATNFVGNIAKVIFNVQ
jgi:hypothetical protein